MKNYSYGALIYDADTDRIDIRFDDMSYYGGLHCGESMEVLRYGEWFRTRIEMNADDEWYLVGLGKISLLGLRTRIAA